MPRITRVYTRGGDDGTTALGGGRRVKKHALRVEAFGTVDELNASIGAAISGGLDDELGRILRVVQNELFHLGSDLCMPEEDKKKTPVPRIEQRHVAALEAHLDRLNAETGPIENFILPGGCEGAARLHLARTVCRRAERVVTALAEQEPVGAYVVPYLNRLSDALFVMARVENKRRGETDVLWDSRA
jgi:cob(I)alamin adenosyltransferase